MRQIVFLLSVLWIVLGGKSADAARKMFVRDIVLHGSCVSDVSVDALRALLAQEMPRDILAHRGLAYEDLSPYLDAGNWNAESFTVREARHIMTRVRQFDMQMMLWLEVSCMPGPGGRVMYVLTGRLMDLDRMDEILTCQDAQARDRRRVCHGNGDVYDAVSFAHVEMESFAGFVPAVRHLLARLLHIPEIEIRLDTSAEVFDIGQRINLSFSVRRNEAHKDTPIRMVQNILRVPADQRQQICREPAQYWDEHHCASKGVRTSCAESMPFQVIDPVKGRQEDAEGGPFIQFRAPSHEDDFLVRAEAVASESGGEVRSAPVYRCLQVRERRIVAGLILRGGFPLNGTSYDDIQKISYAYNPIVFGADISLINAAIPRRSGQPGVGLGYILGGTFASGTSCIENGTPNCTARKTTSWSTELRAQLRLEYFRLRRISFTPYADLGMGLEVTNSYPAHESDGPNYLLMGGWGLAVGGQFGLNPRWDLNWTLGVLYQWRFRITHRESMDTVTVTGPTGEVSTRTVTQGPGIGFLWNPLWITFGLTLAAPLK